MMTAISSLFWFSVKQVINDRKLFLSFFLLAIPSGIAVLFRVLPRGYGYFPPWQLYHVTLQYVLIGGVALLVCMLYAPSVLNTEAESGTLIHLFTRRLKRSSVLVVRFIAAVFALSILFSLSVIAFHLCYTWGVDQTVLGTGWKDGQPWKDTLAYVYCSPLICSAFLAVFLAINLVTSRAMIASGVFLLWEISAAYLPASARVYTVSHQLRRAMVCLNEHLVESFHLRARDLEICFPQGANGLFALSILIIVSLVIGGLCASTREMVPKRVTKD